MHGVNLIHFKNLSNEEYVITMPNIYARGILFGRMFMELGDHASVTCPSSDMICEMEFKIKGMFMGGYNHIAGKIKRVSSGEVLYSIHGKWTDVIYLVNEKTKEESIFFSPEETAKYAIVVNSIEEQEEFESRRYTVGLCSPYWK